MTMIAAAALVLISLAPASEHAPPVQADHADGNIVDDVNYWLVEDQLRVCDDSNRVTTSVLNSAVTMWNDGIGATLLVITCTNWGVRVIDAPEDACEDPPYGDAIACAQLPSIDDTQQRLLRVEPDAPTSNNSLMIDLIAHELGHNLGFNHVPPNGSSCNPDSIMGAALCPTSLGELKQVDITNYHYAYHADAVASFAGSSAVPHTVNFTWDGSDIHNEREYLINWRNNCTGQWLALGLYSFRNMGDT